ncbi:hypothetical protein PMI41_03947 [Phyllobacterium sp. YR531]|nr:hypothetical protein PMI41_03947 [Phyllobacterium sp. YR531]
MAHSGDDPVDTFVFEEGRRGLSIGGRDDAIAIAVKRDSRNRYCGLVVKLFLQFCIAFISRSQTKAMAIGMDHGVDIIGAVKSDGSTLKRSIIELPVG